MTKYLKPSEEQVTQLKIFAQSHGRNWRQALLMAWLFRTVLHPALRELSNLNPPKWIKGYKLPK